METIIDTIDNPIIALNGLRRFLENLDLEYLRREARLIEIYESITDFVGKVQVHENIQIHPDSLVSTTLNYGDSFQAVTTILRDHNGHVVQVNSKNLTIPLSINHSNSGVSPGTYKSVTVNAQGHITNGTNPSTKDGYGLTDVPTINEMNIAIAFGVANAQYLKREVVSVLPSISSADVRTIYMVPSSSPSINNILEEFMVINGVWERIGTTDIDLSGYVQFSNITEVSIVEADSLLGII